MLQGRELQEAVASGKLSQLPVSFVSCSWSKATLNFPSSHLIREDQAPSQQVLGKSTCNCRTQSTAPRESQQAQRVAQQKMQKRVGNSAEDGVVLSSAGDALPGTVPSTIWSSSPVTSETLSQS